MGVEGTAKRQLVTPSKIWTAENKDKIVQFKGGRYESSGAHPQTHHMSCTGPQFPHFNLTFSLPFTSAHKFIVYLLVSSALLTFRSVLCSFSSIFLRHFLSFQLVLLFFNLFVRCSKLNIWCSFFFSK